MIYDGLFLEARRPIDRPADDGFDVSCVPDDSVEHRVPLAQAWAVPLEQAFPLAGSRSGNTAQAGRRGAYVGLAPSEYFSGATGVQG